MEIIKASRGDLLWSYLGYSLSIGSNILILPFIIFYLPSHEVGLWFTFLSIAMLANLVDFGISPSILRNTSYIWSGAKELRAKGLTKNIEVGKPNIGLLNQIMHNARYIYLFIGFFALVMLLIFGTLYIKTITVSYSIDNIYISWCLFSFGIFLNIAFNFWTPLLKGIGQVKSSQKSLVVSKLFFLFASIIFLYLSFGILGIALAYTLSGLILRLYSRFYFLSHIKSLEFNLDTKFNFDFDKNIFNKLWFNSWRLGVVSLGAFAILQSNTLLCSYFFGLELTASYGLAIQIFAVTAALAHTPYQTFLPEFNQVLSYNKFSKAKKIIIKCARLNWLIFIFTSVLIILFLPLITKNIMREEFLITTNMLIFMSIYLFLENNHSMFSGFIAAENKIPFMLPSVLSGFAVVVLSILLVLKTELGIWSLLISPAIIQLIYNNWKWPHYVLKKYSIKLIDYGQI